MKKEVSMPNFCELEEGILKYWTSNNCFEKLKEKNKNSNKYFRFLDGPITANYPMAIHHAWGRTLKDLFLKYKAMNGFDSMFQNGFDAHGLPVELGVEKDLKVNSKKEILEMGLDKFVDACLKRVEKYSSIQVEQSKRLGQWMDWDNSYFTNSDENITSIWHFLKLCDEKGLIVRDSKPLQWCPRCGTSLSEHEMTGSYKDLEHTSVFFKLEVKGENAAIIVWTTTPWTLSSNVAVAVNPENEYLFVKVKSDSRLLIVGKEALKILKDDAVEVVKTVKGSEIVGKEYEPVFPELECQKFVHKIVAWEDVSAIEGSGAVHIAPGCGTESADFELGRRLGLPEIMPIDESGVFYNKFGFLAGKKTNEVNDIVFERLKQDNKLYYTKPIKHSYPVCWRCKEPIVFRLADSWYIKVDSLREQLLNASNSVKWEPDFMKKRMADWLTNMGDWNISRKRFYGIPLPIYPCECGHVHVVGSLEELSELSSKEEVEKMPHIHRPYVDNIKIRCPKCSRQVSRIVDVGDCWLDAGIAPFSTKKYFTDKEFFNRNFPSEVVIEMREQVRLWFYSLLFMSVVITGKAPYERVVAHESVVDENGGRFSKSGYNIEINDALSKIGADCSRYIFAGNPLTSDVRFGYGLGDEARRKLLSFWNTYTFFNTYAVIDNPNLKGYNPDYKTLDTTDKWILARTQQFVEKSRQSYDEYKAFNVIKEFELLVDDLSNFYIRINRRRFWKSEDEQDKLNAYYALYTTLKTIIITMAPIVPFLTEYIYQNLVKEIDENSKESIMLEDFPEVNQKLYNKEVLSQIETARQVLTLAQRLRNENQIKVKQPLKTMFLILPQDKQESVKQVEYILKDELNIKNIEFEQDNQRFNVPVLTVNFKKAGAVLKGEVQKLKQSLEQLSSDELYKAVEGFNNGSVDIKEFKNLSSDLFILGYKAKQEFVIATENNVTVVLDVTIDENLMLEGLYRELVRGCQVLRKQANFAIDQRIKVSFATESETLNKVLNMFNEKIKTEILATEIVDNILNPTIKQTIEVGDEEITICLM